jgi:hypothetical protein
VQDPGAARACSIVNSWWNTHSHFGSISDGHLCFQLTVMSGVFNQSLLLHYARALMGTGTLSF